MSSVPLGRSSCVPITLHCAAYCEVKCCWRSLSDGVVFTRDLKNYKLFEMYFRIPIITKIKDIGYIIKLSYRTRTNFRGTYISLMSQIQHFRDYIFEDHRILA